MDTKGEGEDGMDWEMGRDRTYTIDAVHLLRCVQPSVTPWTIAHQVSLSFAVSWSLLKVMSTEAVIPLNYPLLCQLLLWPSIFPSIFLFFFLLILHIKQRTTDSPLYSTEASPLLNALG